MINPVQAVTAVLPRSVLDSGSLAEAAGGARAGQVPITRAASPGRDAPIVAMSVTAGAFGLGIIAVAGALIIPAGRRRGWKPGGPAARARPAGHRRLPARHAQ